MAFFPEFGHSWRFRGSDFPRGDSPRPTSSVSVTDNDRLSERSEVDPNYLSAAGERDPASTEFDALSRSRRRCDHSIRGRSTQLWLSLSLRPLRPLRAVGRIA